MQSARQDLHAIAVRVLKDTDPADAVVLAWPLVCGAAVAERVRAFAFENETLRVAVPDKGWQSQLEAFNPQYLHRLSKLAGVAVKRISYEIDTSDKGL
jgi:Dna[CI] antecedent, DciA